MSFVGKSNFTGVQLTNRSMCLLQIESLEDGHLRQQQVWSGRSRKAGEFQPTELEYDHCKTRNVVTAGERAAVLVA